MKTVKLDDIRLDIKLPNGETIAIVMETMNKITILTSDPSKIGAVYGSDGLGNPIGLCVHAEYYGYPSD